MTSRTISFRVSEEEYLAYQDRRKEIPYRSLSGYFKSLGRYDLATHRPHVLTARLDELSDEEQERVAEEFVRLYRERSPVAGSWFEHELRDVVEELAAGTIPESAVVDKFLSRLRSRK